MLARKKTYNSIARSVTTKSSHLANLFVFFPQEWKTN